MDRRMFEERLCSAHGIKGSGAWPYAARPATGSRARWDADGAPRGSLEAGPVREGVLREGQRSVLIPGMRRRGGPRAPGDSAAPRRQDMSRRVRALGGPRAPTFVSDGRSCTSGADSRSWCQIRAAVGVVARAREIGRHRRRAGPGAGCCGDARAHKGRYAGPRRVPIAIGDGPGAPAGPQRALASRAFSSGARSRGCTEPAVRGTWNG